MQIDHDYCLLFGQLLRALSDEELLKMERRFQMRKNPTMAGLMRAELEEREDAIHE